MLFGSSFRQINVNKLTKRLETTNRLGFESCHSRPEIAIVNENTNLFVLQD